MKTAFLALLGILLTTTTADAGLFRRRCTYKHKTVHRDCCGNVSKHVEKGHCCPQPCCPAPRPACPCVVPGCYKLPPGHPPIEPRREGPQKPATGDQALAQQKVSYMARNRLTGHPGPRPQGQFFEGTGRSSGCSPGTCTPGRSMRLTGDAVAKGPDGMTYRVRIWR